MTQLLMVIELWYNGRPVDAISIDFDILPHERLLEKLKSYGIDGTRRKFVMRRATRLRTWSVIYDPASDGDWAMVQR